MSPVVRLHRAGWKAVQRAIDDGCRKRTKEVYVSHNKALSHPGSPYAQLRVKFGAPLSREIFRVQPGFDLVVDYGAGNQVCKLQVPALMPADAAKVQNSDDMKQKMHAFFAELVPDSMRAKELRRLMSQTGAFSGVGFDEYEHVTFVETHSGSET